MFLPSRLILIKREKTSVGIDGGQEEKEGGEEGGGKGEARARGDPEIVAAVAAPHGEKQLILVFVSANTSGGTKLAKRAPGKVSGEKKKKAERERSREKKERKKERVSERNGRTKGEKATAVREDKFYYRICKQSVSRLRICPITRTICFSMP